MGQRSKCYCKGCGATILWMYTAAKRLIPVDYRHDLEDIDQFNEKKMVSHFATCTKAGDYRKEKKK